jgi:hypothetical protein
MRVSVSKVTEGLYSMGYCYKCYSELLEELSKHYGFQFIVNNGVVLKSDDKEYACMVPYVRVEIKDTLPHYTYDVYYRDFAIVNKILVEIFRDILRFPILRLDYIKIEYYLDYFKNDIGTLKFDKRVLVKTLEFKCNEEMFKDMEYLCYTI